MSTSLSRIAAILATVALWGAALGFAEGRFEGRIAHEADRIADEVTRASNLGAPCRLMAARLAEAVLLDKASSYASAPDSGAETVDMAAEAYERLRCPVRAMPGISVGVNEALRRLPPDAERKG